MIRRIALIIVTVFLAVNIQAQTNIEEIDYMQALFGMEKRAAIKEYLQLRQGESVVFWKIYDEYEVKRKLIEKERFTFLDQFINKAEIMTDKESHKWMKDIIDLRNKNEKLIATYYKKVDKKCTGLTAMKFYQIESYVLAGQRFQILELAPF